jgi:hypothetical protein
MTAAGGKARKPADMGAPGRARRSACYAAQIWVIGLGAGARSPDGAAGLDAVVLAGVLGVKEVARV